MLQLLKKLDFLILEKRMTDNGVEVVREQAERHAKYYNEVKLPRNVIGYNIIF